MKKPVFNTVLKLLQFNFAFKGIEFSRVHQKTNETDVSPAGESPRESSDKTKKKEPGSDDDKPHKRSLLGPCPKLKILAGVLLVSIFGLIIFYGMK